LDDFVQIIRRGIHQTGKRALWLHGKPDSKAIHQLLIYAILMKLYWVTMMRCRGNGESGLAFILTA